MNALNVIKAVVFDWGDTLMVNYSDFIGPMVDWPQVSAVSGAQQILDDLSGKYHLALATNAEESDASRVKAALARVRLDEKIENIFTPHELNGFRKPDKAFFRAIEQTLGISRNNLVMVGDDPIGDIAGATLAGWRAIWLNSNGRAAPGSLPLHSAEIIHLLELPTALQALSLPGVEQARAWLLEQGSSANLLVHVEMVACLAYQMALWLRAAGHKVDPVLAHRGGLLHDLAKISARGTRHNHSVLGALSLEEKGQPELARIAHSHMLFNILVEDSCPSTWEEKLVYYADKLVEGGQVVSMDVRMQALRERYNIDPQQVKAVIAEIRALEQKICLAVGCTKEELLTRLQTAFLSG
jgi:putative hydrolase of the HAD superfamily